MKGSYYDRELYYGNIRPFESKAPRIQEYKESTQNAIRIENEFLSKLNEDEKELFEKLQRAEYDIKRLENINAFKNSFSLGVRLMLAILPDKDEADTY